MLYEELNKRKKELGLTTEQLSQLSGVPAGTVNKILSGETRSPRYDTLRALEKILYGGPESEQDAVREPSAVCSRKKQGEYTVEDYRRLPEDVRAELIDGELIVLEAPDFTHQELIAELLFEIKLFIRKNGGPCRILPSPLDVRLDRDERTMVQPDIALICQSEKITKKGIYGAPDLCIEIVSDSTRKRDYGIKMQKYMAAGVQEYWIVDPKRKSIVCYCFEGEDAPYISMYTFSDKVPVRVYGEELKIGFAEIAGRIWKE